jgi:uncharacterized lipoprotein
MAYAREEKENLEVDYPLNELWESLPKAVEQLNWKIEETNQEKHHLVVKTKGGFLSYPSKLLIDLIEVNEKATRMNIMAETPVTTITSIADYGRTRDRIEQLVVTLAKILENKDSS